MRNSDNADPVGKHVVDDAIRKTTELHPAGPTGVLRSALRVVQRSAEGTAVLVEKGVAKPWTPGLVEPGCFREFPVR